MAVSLMRTLVMYGVILVAVRLMGKRQISQLQTSELVATLLVSELAVLPIQEMDQPLWKGIIPMGVLVGCEILVSFLMLKSGRFRQAVCGSPVVVIRQGKVLQDQMRRLRLTTEDLYEQLRQNNVFYLEDVAWAIVETNGRLSVIRHPEEEPLTPRQLGLQPEFPGLGPAEAAGTPAGLEPGVFDGRSHRRHLHPDKKTKKGRAGPFRRTLKRACPLAAAGKGPFPAKRGRLRHPLLPVYQPAASSSALWI